ncbi:MAG: 1-phosphofructokinase family hexose kinase [Phycisphaerales bacterium]|jgi:tagatose 6-phosphate kinase|nr:1-phosphofructokinase family hexose kinase [Phycisphaerales bacterium]
MILCLGTTPALQRTMRFKQFALDVVNRAVEVHDYASGKVINVARVVHQLGHPVVASGFLGGDSGRFMRADMDKTGIRHDFVTVNPPTRQCITLLDDSTKTSSELVEEAAEVEQSAWDRLDETLHRHLKQAAALVLTGSMTPNAPADFFTRCTAAANERKIPVILDTRGEPLKHALPQRPTVVKPNVSELAATVGREILTDADLRGAIILLVEQGAQWAIITRGPKPAIVSDGRSFWSVTTPAVPVLNTIGSGDAFTAGLAVELSRGQTLPDACRLAIACGAANAMTLWAGFVEPQKVRELQAKIQIAPW